jgi:hypothetical protein
MTDQPKPGIGADEFKPITAEELAVIKACVGASPDAHWSSDFVQRLIGDIERLRGAFEEVHDTLRQVPDDGEGVAYAAR